jgi:metallo-beta-lactamase family protein
MKVTFLGASGTVTGSKFLIETAGSRILLDCGLFQGLKALRLRNWDTFPVPPSSIDAVVLTHAHIDHTGYLPLLVRNGFAGKIYCTPPTAALCDILLPDSGRIQEQDAEYANRKKFSKHRPALPLYTEEDALRVSRHFETVPWGRPLELDDLTVRFQTAGHILGASSVHLTTDEGTILFSGDLGRERDALMFSPAAPPASDWIVMESTYGDRRHPETHPMEGLARLVRDAIERKGVLLIPSFAVGRAQHLIYWLNRVFQEGLAPRIPVFVDSPMATNVTHLYREFTDYHRLSPDDCGIVCEGAEFTASVEQSKWLETQSGPIVILSASGMLTGGRVLHHLKTFGPRKETIILLAGYQAAGTRGRTLLQGGDELKIHGQWVKIRARVENFQVLSAHADQRELLGWVESAERPPKKVFLVHGEPGAADALRMRIHDRLGLDVSAAVDESTVELARP